MMAKLPHCSPLLQSVFIAQLLSFLLCITGITAQKLADAGVSAPTFQSFLIYLLLFITCGPYHVWSVCKRRREAAAGRGGAAPLEWQSLAPQPQPNGFGGAAAQKHAEDVAAACRFLSSPVWAYALLAVLDVEGNFLVTKAYQYTSLTSVTLLDCFTIPVVMLLSFTVLGLRYKAGHLGGAALCVSGLTVLVLTDGASETGGPRPALGDCLVLAGAAVYAICNVTQERLLTAGTPTVELLAVLGMFGAMVSGTQALLLERPAIAAIFAYQPDVGSPLTSSAGALAGFVAALYCFYILVPQVLRGGGSTVLNLSLLTSDLWAALARVALFGGFGGTGHFFAVAVLCEAAGMALYVWSGEAEGMEGRGKDKGKGGRKGVSAAVRYDRLAMAEETRAAVLGACAEMREADEERGPLVSDRSAFPASDLWSSPARSEGRRSEECRRDWGTAAAVVGADLGQQDEGALVAGQQQLLQQQLDSELQPLRPGRSGHHLGPGEGVGQADEV